jgi:hypothetical protein
MLEIERIHPAFAVKVIKAKGREIFTAAARIVEDGR